MPGRRGSGVLRGGEEALDRRGELLGLIVMNVVAGAFDAFDGEIADGRLARFVLLGVTRDASDQPRLRAFDP